MTANWPVFIVFAVVLLVVAAYTQVKNMKDIMSFNVPWRRIFLTIGCGIGGGVCLAIGLIGYLKS